MFSCILIAFPIGFLLPFGLFGEFKIIPVDTFIGLFLVFPLGYFIYSIYKSIKDFRAKDKVEKAKILKTKVKRKYRHKNKLKSLGNNNSKRQNLSVINLKHSDDDTNFLNKLSC